MARSDGPPKLMEGRRKRGSNQSSRKESLDCFVARAPRNDDDTCLRDLAARSARVVHELSAPNSEGAGNAGCPMHPQPRVQMKQAHEHSHHGHTGFTRHCTRHGFTASFALSPVTTPV